MSDSVFDVINRRFVSGNSICVERAHVTQSEWQEITRLKSEVERLRLRVAEAEFLQKVYILRKQAEAVDQAAKKARSQNKGNTEWGEGFVDGCNSVADGLTSYAESLRQQAYKLEQNQ